MTQDARLNCLTAIVVLALPSLGMLGTANGTVISWGGETIDMHFVTVGDAGNTADTRHATPGYGAVGYEYDIGTCAVTKSQWDTVVNADLGDVLNDPGTWSGNRPVALISWHDAAMFCNWLTSGDVTQGVYAINGGLVTNIDRSAARSAYGTTYFIPTEDEWYKAAYYKGGGTDAGYWDYPTQDDLANPPDGIGSLGDPVFDAVFYDGYNESHPRDADKAGVLGPYGTMGQGGNVWEWNETAIGSSRGLRGGYYASGEAHLRAAARSGNNPLTEHVGYGFRVASAPVPETGSVLVWASLGVIGLVWFRRRK